MTMETRKQKNEEVGGNQEVPENQEVRGDKEVDEEEAEPYGVPISDSELEYASEDD